MPNDIPAAAKEALNAERTSDTPAVLVTISDTSLAAPLRYTDCAKVRLSTEPLAFGLVSAGQSYRYALKGAVLPDDTEENSQATTIVIDNVAEDVAPAIRGLSPDATVSIAMVMVSVPDTQFVAFAGLKIVDRSYDVETVVIEVSRHANRAGSPDLLYPLSGERQTRRKAPGLHR